MPVMIGASLLCWALAYDRRVGWADGAFMLALMAAYTVWTIRRSRREAPAAAGGPAAAAPRPPAGSVLAGLGLVAGGLALLVLGAAGSWTGASRRPGRSTSPTSSPASPSWRRHLDAGGGNLRGGG